MPPQPWTTTHSPGLAAPGAGALALTEGDDHTVACLEGANLGSDFFDHTAHFVAQDMGELEPHADPVPIARPTVPVATAHTVGLDTNHRTIGRTGRIGDVLNNKRFPHHLHYCCSHNSLR